MNVQLKLAVFRNRVNPVWVGTLTLAGVVIAGQRTGAFSRTLTLSCFWIQPSWVLALTAASLGIEHEGPSTF